MRISVDAHAIGRHLTGNEVYVKNLLNAFSTLDSQAEFIAYISSPAAAALVPPSIATRSVAHNPFLRLGRDLARAVRRDRPALLHVQYTAPLTCCVPTVVSVHDVSFLQHPEFFLAARRVQLQITVRRTVLRAARVLTPSEFSRQAVASAYGLDPSRITVVPNAVSSEFRPLPRETAAAWVRSRFHVPAPYIVSVGDLQPRKNHIGLIRAFEILLRDCPHLPHRLLLVGKDTWFAPRVRRAAAASPAAARIHFTGFVDDPELLQIYAGCDLFVFPSFYEGFGLPILEAMACARAVACSNTSAMPEVADAAALLFDPHDCAAIACAMKDLLLDAELRARMERLGQQRAASFTWTGAARQTLAVYHEVAGLSPRESRDVQTFSAS